VAWIILAAYLWSIWRRLARVERELADAARRVAGAGPAAAPAGRREGHG
jgi:hypothetical protein